MGQFLQEKCDVLYKLYDEMQSHSWFPTSSLITSAIIQDLYPSSLHLASGFRMSVQPFAPQPSTS